MYMINENFIELAKYLQKNEDLLNIQSEVAQINGAIECVSSSKITVAFCGKSDSHFDYLLKLLSLDSIEWNEILYTVPFKIVYGQAYSIKWLNETGYYHADKLSDISENDCQLIEITINAELLKNMNILFANLLDGNVQNIFNSFIAASDYVILCPNFSNAVGIEYHTICKLIRHEWQQPERVKIFAYDIQNLSLPSTMIKALSENLGIDYLAPNKVVDDLSSFSENQQAILSLLKFEDQKQSVIPRTYSYVDSACKKATISIEEHKKQKEIIEDEIESFSDKLNAFKAQAVIHIPSLGAILDDNLKSDIFSQTAEYIGFVQGKINEELRTLSKDEMEAYVPVYYSYLISEFVKEMGSSVLLPKAQKKFDEIIEQILNSYRRSFAVDIPNDLLEKTKIAKSNFFSFVDRTMVDKTDVGFGMLESVLIYILVSENPILFIFSEEIALLANRIKRGIVNVYDRYIRSTESYAKEVSNRVNSVLDENLQNIPQQIENVLFPALEKNMRKALENFVDEASKPFEEALICKRQRIEDIQKNITELRNIQNNLGGLIKKCN